MFCEDFEWCSKDLTFDGPKWLEAESWQVLPAFETHWIHLSDKKKVFFNENGERTAFGEAPKVVVLAFSDSSIEKAFRKLEG
jgi:hypothetical protein